MLRRLGSHPLGYVALVVTAALLLSALVAMTERAMQMLRITQEEARLQREVGALAARNAALRVQRDFYSSDLYVERIAREELGLVKPGETGVMLVRRAPSGPATDAQDLPTPAPSPAPAEGPEAGVWDRWRAWLGGW